MGDEISLLGFNLVGGGVVYRNKSATNPYPSIVQAD